MNHDMPGEHVSDKDELEAGGGNPTTPATQAAVSARFGTDFPLIGMVHLEPLPGSPNWHGSMDDVLARAEADSRAILEGGMDALIVENIGDLPFFPDEVPPETIAAMTRVVAHLRRRIEGRRTGVSVLRNDARAALAIAAATGAGFLRVNVHSGSMFTDQGLIQGEAHHTLRRRAVLAPGVLLVADVMVKHAQAPAGMTAEGQARDLRHRGLADVLVVSGPETGALTDLSHLRAVRSAVPEAAVWVGSGFRAENAAEFRREADGAIVGTGIHAEDCLELGVEPTRVRQLVEAVRSSRLD